MLCYVNSRRRSQGKKVDLNTFRKREREYERERREREVSCIFILEEVNVNTTHSKIVKFKKKITII